MSLPDILIIDDSPTNLKLLRVLLLSEGFSVRSAVHAAQALAELERSVPDAILTDLQLPDMDGLELTRRIKADPRFATVPVVAVTAFAMVADRQQALAVGCADYISKPIDTRLLPGLLRGLLARRL